MVFKNSIVLGKLTRGLIALLPVLMLGGCRPADQRMLVAYVRGSWVIGVTPGTWNVGETKDCEIASRSPILPDSRGDVLLCGEVTRETWGLAAGNDLRSQIYEAATPRDVAFVNSGHPMYSGSKFTHTLWQCERAGEDLRCR